MSENLSIRRALISVSDKTGIVDFVRVLQSYQVEIISTGGTAKLLQENQLDVIEVSDYTTFPEIMGGRVKTLHPHIFAGILRRQDIDEPVLQEMGMKPIDLIVVNLYPFEQTILQPNHQLSDAIENIDIGGPSLIRASAKNHDLVSVIVDKNGYTPFLNELHENDGKISHQTRFELAKKAFAYTAQYDATIANYFEDTKEQQHNFPQTLNLQYNKICDLRYGENPHQKAAYYRDPISDNHTAITNSIQLQGKALSFNNIVDADTAWECVKLFDASPACVIVKHANPCGVARGVDLLDAYQRAYKTDPLSAFGGIIAFNQPIDQQIAETIIAQQFVEVIIAPMIESSAQEIFAKKPNLRVLTFNLKEIPIHPNNKQHFDYKCIRGGLLIQDCDTHKLEIDNSNSSYLSIVTERAPSEKEMKDLLFAWKVAQYVKSNAIVYANNHATIGIGAGQMSRVISAKIANLKADEAGLPTQGAVMASDAFFPFRDGIDAAAEVGITAIIQPGGSKRDTEVIQAANEAGIAMVFTAIRHFRH